MLHSETTDNPSNEPKSPPKSGKLATAVRSILKNGLSVSRPSSSPRDHPKWKDSEVSSLSQQICLDLLVDGNVRSFSEFFKLVADKKDGKVMAVEKESPEKLLHLREILADAEHNKRKGAAKATYDSLINIAKYFESLDLVEAAEKYYKDGIEMAKMLPTHDFAVEGESHLNYGLFLEHLDRNAEALTQFEQARSLAHSVENAELEMKTSRHVVHVRIRMAEELEKEEKTSASIAHYQKCMEVLQQASLNLTDADKSQQLELHFRLGKAHKTIGDIDNAIKAKMTKKTGDRSKEGWAKVILAACYESSNDINLAVSYLQQFLSTAENDPTQKFAASQACNQLGHLFNTMGKYKESVHYYDLHYRLCVEIEKEKNSGHRHHHHHNRNGANEPIENNDPSGNELKLAMIQLGMARANSQMEELFKHVQTSDKASLGSLLQWKGAKSKNVQLLRPENIEQQAPENAVKTE